MPDLTKLETQSHNLELRGEVHRLLAELGVRQGGDKTGTLKVHTPITGKPIGQVTATSDRNAVEAIEEAHTAFNAWRLVPAPKRAELVRLLGQELRANKEALGRLVSIEAGKIVSEGLDEVQAMIGMCSFAVGLTRNLYGLTMATEHAERRVIESWHPLGVTGIISAFNSPVAFWARNAIPALLCGNSVVWKPSEKTPLTALATQALLGRALKRFEQGVGIAPDGLSALLIGSQQIGEVLVDHQKVALVVATGSTAMGRAVRPRLAKRFARAILELRGSNAAIVAPTADIDLTLRHVVLGAVGTTGQRCTTLRRLFVHESIYHTFVPRLKSAYASVTIGNPLEPGTLVGPLIDAAAYHGMQSTLQAAKATGGTPHGGERVVIDRATSGYYVRPALVEMAAQAVERETCAPILHLIKYRDFDSVLEMHNALEACSSSIFTNDLREAEIFLSTRGSDCRVANVNIGPYGAEIGGAFGSENETGCGLEFVSEAWKVYMRRVTSTVKHGRTLPFVEHGR